MLNINQAVTPINWYRYDISTSIELMNSFITGVETQASNLVKEYQSGVRERIIMDLPEFGVTIANQHFQGLEDDTWDLDRIFCSYFPSLQRSSALITLFGFFEFQLFKLCDIYQKYSKLNISHKHLSGKGIVKARVYLEKVINLETRQNSSEWQEIKNIQKIRNLIVHSNNSLIDSNGNTKNVEQDYVHRSAFLEGNSEIIMLEGFLNNALSSFYNYFRLLSIEIESRENA